MNTVVKIETGDNANPTVETLQKIAKALNVSISDLFKEIKSNFGNFGNFGVTPLF